MSLKEYQKKRNFSKTSEPRGKVKGTASKKHIFVVHEHHARNLHWDLRLQMRGVLKSWAIPKRPPISKNLKRLAIQVEDHPLGYAKFEGIIPKGHYGAGKVEIWDKGTFEIESAKPDKIVFHLQGTRLIGKYVLVKTKYGAKPEKSWLFFKI